MKYRKKPVVVEAFQWIGGPDQTEDPVWACEAIKSGKIWFSNPGTKDVCMEIETLEGVMCARQGDFIIQGVKGEIYPCKSDIFSATYEPAEKPAPERTCSDCDYLCDGGRDAKTCPYWKKNPGDHVKHKPAPDGGPYCGGCELFGHPSTGAGYAKCRAGRDVCVANVACGKFKSKPAPDAKTDGEGKMEDGV
jgi:hypothetical protein